MAHATFLKQKQHCFSVSVVNTKSLVTALAVKFLSIFQDKETEETLQVKSVG